MISAVSKQLRRGHNINLSESNAPRLHQDQQQCWRLSKSTYIFAQLVEYSPVVQLSSHLKARWNTVIYHFKGFTAQSLNKSNCAFFQQSLQKKVPNLHNHISREFPTQRKLFKHHPLQWSSRMTSSMAMMAIVAFSGKMVVNDIDDSPSKSPIHWQHPVVLRPHRGTWINWLLGLRGWFSLIKHDR